MTSDPARELRHAALEVLRERDPRIKAARCIALYAARGDGTVELDPDAVIDEPEGVPGRPVGVMLVHPHAVARRGLGTLDGRIALYHSLCHIEANAVQLALDAVWRFASMPAAFYDDWLRVAAEEARHFGWLADRLESLGSRYGALPVHDGLWEAAERTRGDVLARMALVPRTLEARGLDVTPGMRDRLRSVGDVDGARLLDAILIDEIEHVRIGNAWYHHLCEAAGRDPARAHDELAAVHGVGLPRGPFNLEARRKAGFEASELEAWAATSAAA